MATFYLIVVPGIVLLRLPLASSRSGLIGDHIIADMREGKLFPVRRGETVERS